MIGKSLINKKKIVTKIMPLKIQRVKNLNTLKKPRKMLKRFKVSKNIWFNDA